GMAIPADLWNPELPLGRLAVSYRNEPVLPPAARLRADAAILLCLPQDPLDAGIHTVRHNRHDRHPEQYA
ncbi:MAG: hypothetical protein R3C08_16555, partial [Hyphomonas sp.]